MERAGQTQQTEEIFTQACRHINKGRQKVMNLYLTFLWEYSSRPSVTKLTQNSTKTHILPAHVLNDLETVPSAAFSKRDYQPYKPPH